MGGFRHGVDAGDEGVDGLGVCPMRQITSEERKRRAQEAKENAAYAPGFRGRRCVDKKQLAHTVWQKKGAKITAPHNSWGRPRERSVAEKIDRQLDYKEPKALPAGFYEPLTWGGGGTAPTPPKDADSLPEAVVRERKALTRKEARALLGEEAYQALCGEANAKTFAWKACDGGRALCFKYDGHPIQFGLEIYEGRRQ